MKITPIINSYFKSPIYNKADNAKLSQTYASNIFDLNNLYYRDCLMFCGRVDKSLSRFYCENKDKMPLTLRKYIESLDELSISPVDAQFNAFEGLLIAENVQDVKEYYKDEPLFQNLVDISETRAPKGILYDIKVMKDTLEECSENVLNSGEDFSIYLLRKIFLEAKGLREINIDLHNDLNPVFQKEDKQYVRYSTLRALGIKLPNENYLTSLRFTKEGYSDIIGEKITKAKAKYQSNLTEVQKAKISSKRSIAMTTYWQSLTQEDRAELSDKNRRAQIQRWQRLSAQEKTQVIEKMQTGSKIQRLAMIDAWNNCDEIRVALSKFLTEKNMQNAERLIYKTSEYSQYQSKVMSEFWATNPEFSELLGEQISLSYAKVKQANEIGTLDQLEKEITEIQTKKKNDIKNKPFKTTQESKQEENHLKNLHKEFRKRYCTQFSFLPKSYLDKYCDYVKHNINDPRMLDIWIRALKDEVGSNGPEFKELAKYLSEVKEDDEILKAKLAIEQAMAEILYEASGGNFASGFSMKYNELSILCHNARNEKNYPLLSRFSVEQGGEYNVLLLKPPNFSKLDFLYKKYNAKLPAKTQEKIVNIGILSNILSSADIEESSALGMELKENFERSMEIAGTILEYALYNCNDKQVQENILRKVKLFGIKYMTTH